MRESAAYAAPADHSAAILFKRADICSETVGYHMSVNRTARAITRFTYRLDLSPHYTLMRMRLAYENACRAQIADARNNAKSPAAIGFMRPIAAGLVVAGGLVAASVNCWLGMR